MTLQQARYQLNRLKKQYLFLRLAETLLWAIATAGFVYALLCVTPLPLYAYAILPLTGAAVFIIFFRKYKLHRPQQPKIIAFIDRHYAVLEESADLLLNDNTSLTLLQQLQQQRTLEQFNHVHTRITFPHRLGRAALVLGCSIAVAFMFSSFRHNGRAENTSTRTTHNQAAQPPAVKLPAAIKALAITIVPPPYTALPAVTSANPHLTMAEGSNVTWTLTFTDAITEASLVFSTDETLALTKKNNTYTTSRKFTTSTFYQVRWKNASGEVKTSDYYKADVIRDQPPQVAIDNLQQSMVLTINDKLSIPVKATISDDYYVSDAYIIATVSKGSGESVKFREERLSFTSPAQPKGKQFSASRTIDILKLGLEPGDELYFYAEAIDNRKPVPNRARTETFFITLQDTASNTLSVEGGLGVDLMPDYFRSQRQIIIDSEKLLKERKQISKHTFNSKSNELGYDQKVLRLKYGEFLGEEFETQIGEAHLPEDDTHEATEDIAAKYGHAHDTENEHNLVEEKKPEAHHEHKHEGEDHDDNTKNLMDAYKHNHDDPEEATFFNQSIRSKLKAALTLMWDAELYLRLYDPEKSLPYQYKALKILKEISNDSRIYVHKTGFDAPPLKEEKRLTADLTEINGSRREAALTAAAIYPAIGKALALVEEKLQHHGSVTITGADGKVLHEAGRELSQLVLERPGQFLQALSLIKAVNENEVTPQAMPQTLAAIRKAFWQALPQEKTSPAPGQYTTHSLDRAFIKNLEVNKR